MKNTKKVRLFIGGVLAVAFAFQFLLVGIGSTVVNAELLNKNIPSDFTYTTDTLNNFRGLNVASFLGKPVKIPFESANPDKIPGGDQDFAIIYPPRILDKNASVPLRAIYFSSGKEITPENAQFVQNIEKFVNSVGDNNPVMLEIMKNLVESNMRMSVKDNGSLFSIIQKYVGTRRGAFLPIAQAEDTGTSPLLTSDDMSELTDSLKDLDTENPQVKQLLVLVLLLIMVNQSMAQSLNSDKQDCVDMGGEWINETCESEEKTVCEDNGGTFKKFTNSCVKDKQICGNEDLQCSSEKEVDEDNNYLDIYGCACKSGQCLDDDGFCVAKNDSKKRACENSGGAWREFFDAEELCLQKCGSTSSSCIGATASSSSQGLMGCDCTEATGTGTQWTQGTTTAPKTCLSATGACIARDTSKDDDDKDGVPNGQDRCPNSTPDGSGTVNMNLGSPDAGCTCTQLQAMGRMQNQQQQCPPDGCETGTPYMVRYDRSQQNNPNQQCQNGIIPQQQQQQYSGSGQYGSTTCPVISRMPTEECEREMERRNQNKNKNDNLSDLLKKLLDDKKKQDQKDKNKNQGGGGGGGGGGTGGPTDTGNKNTNADTGLKPGAKISAAIDPKGVGAHNSPRNGQSKDPYFLHASQFTKVCGENTYVLTNASATKGDFKNDPSSQTNANTKEADALTPCKDCNNDSNAINGINKIRDAIKANPGQISQEALQKINEIIGKINSGQIKGPSQGPALKEITEWFTKGKQQAAEAKSKTPVSSGKGAKTMKNLQEKNETYFKVPKCEELAANHCCVCSCCDKSKKDCGWSIGKDCKDGKCTGQNCDAESCKNCSEEPAKSIQLVMGKQIPNDLKQADNKCYEVNHEKKETSVNLCKNYKDPTHVGICRYDCEGNEKGCATERDNCKIIVQVKDGKDLTYSMEENKADTNRVQPGEQLVKFTNQKDGSVIKGAQGSGSEWMEKLKDERGKACNCDKEPKNSDGSDGIAKPDKTQQQQTEDPYNGTSPESQRPPTTPPPTTPPPTTPQPPYTTPYSQTDPWPSNGAMTKDEQQNEMLKDPVMWGDYMKDNNKDPAITWEDWRDYQDYKKWYDNGYNKYNNFTSQFHRWVWGDFENYKGTYRDRGKK